MKFILRDGGSLHWEDSFTRYDLSVPVNWFSLTVSYFGKKPYTETLKYRYIELSTLEDLFTFIKTAQFGVIVTEFMIEEIVEKRDGEILNKNDIPNDLLYTIDFFDGVREPEFFEEDIE